MKPQPIANPPNPWASTEREYLEPPVAKLEVFEDHSKEIIARNDSPDVGFEFSVNPYRGCMHACAYCYARPGHQYLDFGAGSDFDTRITIKPRAPELLRAAFERPSWKGALLAFSGVTDCYQPLEASLRLTRRCLEVCAEYRNPVGIITKSPLIERDLDVLQELHAHAQLQVNISIPLWDTAHARALEPGVATPRRRIQIIQRLAAAGIQVGVMVAPIIPGLGDEGMAEVLAAAREAGATTAGYVLLRLPGAVKDVFLERLRKELPLRADKVLHRIRETRGGALYDAHFGTRGRGDGIYADAIAALFQRTVRRLQFTPPPARGPTPFRRPSRPGRQLSLL